MKRYDQAILIALAVVFRAGIFFTARSAFSSYLTFAEAKESNRAIQVKGTAAYGSLRMIDTDSFSFELKDMSDRIYQVTHTGAVPVNLFEADYVVVAGKFDGEEFAAGKILVKCPTRFMPAGQ